DAGQEAADPAEAVQDHVSWALGRLCGPAQGLGELLRQDGGNIAAGADIRGEPAQVDRAGAQVQLGQLPGDRECLVQVQVDAVEVAGVAGRPDDPRGGPVGEAAPVHGQAGTALAGQAGP